MWGLLRRVRILEMQVAQLIAERDHVQPGQIVPVPAGGIGPRYHRRPKVRGERIDQEILAILETTGAALSKSELTKAVMKATGCSDSGFYARLRECLRLGRVVRLAIGKGEYIKIVPQNSKETRVGSASAPPLE